MVGQTDGWMDGQTKGQLDGQKDSWTDRRTDGQTEKQLDRRTWSFIRHQQTNKPESCECDFRGRISLFAPQPCFPLGGEVDDLARQIWVLVQVPEVRCCLQLFHLLFRCLNLSLRGSIYVMLLYSNFSKNLFYNISQHSTIIIQATFFFKV